MKIKSNETESNQCMQLSLDFKEYDIANKCSVDSKIESSVTPIVSEELEKSPEQLELNFRFDKEEKFDYSWGSSGYDKLAKWVIKGVIPAESFGVCAGASGGFKTFWAAEVAYSIATGIEFLGHKVYKGLVLYIAAEGQAGIKKRIKALELEHGLEAVNLAVIDMPVMVSIHDQKQRLLNAIAEMEEVKNEKVQLIIIDTLARSFDGDENTPKDMGNFISACDSIKSLAKVTVLCIHHMGKDESKGGRGHSSLKAASDFEYFIKRKLGAMSYTLINTKMKDSEELDDIQINLDVVDIGIKCDEGEAITSLVRRDNPSFPSFKDTLESNPYYMIIVRLGRCKRSYFRDEVKNTMGQNFDGAARTRMSKAINRLEELGVLLIDKTPSKSDDHILSLIE